MALEEGVRTPHAARQTPSVVTYRVATIQPDACGIWVLHAREYADRDTAQQAAQDLVLSTHVDRPRNAGIVLVIAGTAQVPASMQVRADAVGQGEEDDRAEQPVWRAEQEARTVRPSEVRVALEEALQQARGIVVLEVRRPGQQAVRARLAQITWAAVWDALALDPEDEDEGQQEGEP